MLVRGEGQFMVERRPDRDSGGTRPDKKPDKPKPDRPEHPHMPEQPDKPRPDSELEVACRRHLEFIRKNCPGLLPEGQVKPGTPVEPLPVEEKRATELVRAAVKDAVRSQTGRSPLESAPDVVIWTGGADSLLVFLDTIRVTTGEGLVTVGVDVAADQLRAETQEPRAHVDVDLVVGTPGRPTGLLAAATTPRGPAVVVDRWQDALVALAWQALLDTAAALSAAAGSDTDGTALIASRWTASKDGLTIGPQARHPFDRTRATSSRVTNSRVTSSR
jgi:hypothetical protein